MVGLYRVRGHRPPPLPGGSSRVESTLIPLVPLAWAS